MSTKQPGSDGENNQPRKKISRRKKPESDQPPAPDSSASPPSASPSGNDASAQDVAGGEPGSFDERPLRPDGKPAYEASPSGSSGAAVTAAPEGKKKRRIPRVALWFVVPLVVFSLTYYSLMQPGNVEALAQNLIRNNTNAELRLDVRRASLVYGFDIRNIELRVQNDDSSGGRLFQADRLRLSYFLPGFFAGKIGVRELGLEGAEIQVIRENGAVNWDRAFPGDGKADEPEEEEEEDDEPRESIALPAPLRLFANLKVTGLAFKYEDRDADGESLSLLELRNVDLILAVITREFDEIPLSLQALDLFDTLIVSLAPYRPVSVTVRGPERSLRGQSRTAVYLYREAGGGVPEFASRLNLDTRGLIARRLPEGAPRNLALSLFYDMRYDAPRDRLVIDELELRNGRDRWLRFDAVVDQIAARERSLELAFAPSEIALDELGVALGSLLALENAPIRGDYARINELQISGKLDRLRLQSELEAGRLVFGQDADAPAVENFAVDLDAQIDLYQALGFIEPPPGYERNPELAFGLFYNVDAPTLRLTYDKARLDGMAEIRPESGVRASVRVENLRLERFVPDVLEGTAEGDLNFTSPESFDWIGFDGMVRLSNGRYFLDRSRSGLHLMSLATGGKLFFNRENFEIEIDRLRLDARAQNSGENMLALQGKGLLSFGDDQLYDLSIPQLRINYNTLHAALPGALQYQLQPYKLYLSENISLGADLEMRFAEEGASIDTAGTLAIPFLNLDDLEFRGDLFFGEEEIGIQPLTLKALRGALAVNANGRMRKRMQRQADGSETAVWEPDLKLRASVAREEFLRVHENIALQGRLNVSVDMNPDFVRGRLDIQDLNLEYSQGECDKSAAGAECYRLLLDQLNAELPFEHNLRFAVEGPARRGPGGQYFNSYGRAGEANLSLRSVSSNQTPGGEFARDGYYYLGRPDEGAGLTARMEYANNRLQMNWLRVAVFKRSDPRADEDGKLLPDASLPLGAVNPGADGDAGTATTWTPNGTIDGRELYFSLADLEPEHMAFGANLQIKNLDLRPFLPQTSSSYDGVISADLKAEGANLEDPLYNTTALANVFRISREFSGFVARILMPSQVAGFLVRNTLEIPSIRVELRGGLVYSYIAISRGRLFPGLLIAPADEEIKQERMPLAQFLQRARSEVRDFGDEGADSPDAAANLGGGDNATPANDG